MKSGKMNKAKAGELWYDPILNDIYLVLKVYRKTKKYKIVWIEDLTETFVHFEDCEMDSFVRKLSKLEAELY